MFMFSVLDILKTALQTKAFLKNQSVHVLGKISRSLTFFQILWENYGFITIMLMLQFVQLKFKFHIHGTFYH